MNIGTQHHSHIATIAAVATRQSVYARAVFVLWISAVENAGT